MVFLVVVALWRTLDWWLWWRDKLLISRAIAQNEELLASESAQENSQPLVLVDGIAPFFQPETFELMADPETGVFSINWSKIPFEELEQISNQDEVWQRIHLDWIEYLEYVQALGVTAITVDDLVHLVGHPAYPPELQTYIIQYQDRYGKLFAEAHNRNLDVFVTTDIISTSAHTSYESRNVESAASLFRSQVTQLLEVFPEVSGVIIRIGESDGQDVGGRFTSQLVVKTPQELEYLVSQSIPVFEQHDLTMILRTWSHGSYPVGDLFWNYRTYHRALSDIESDNFIVSAKIGPNDFFRHLDLNPVLKAPQHQVIAEFQPKQEYEMMAGLPSFLGYEYARNLSQLAENPRLAGISLWLQTGGWGSTPARAYFDDSTWMTDLNARVLMSLFRAEAVDTAQLVDSTLYDICLELAWCSDPKGLLVLAESSDQVVLNLLYVSDQPRYVRRIMIPPVTWTYWNQVLIDSPLSFATTLMTSDHQAVLERLPEVLSSAETLQQQMQEFNLSSADDTFVTDTALLLSSSLRVVLENDSSEKEKLEALSTTYSQMYPHAYRVEFGQEFGSEILIRYLWPVVTRSQPRYRVIDYVFQSPPVSAGFRWLVSRYQSDVPEFAQENTPSYELLFY